MVQMETLPSEAKAGSGHKYPEGRIAKAIEQRTAKLPLDAFLWAAGAAIIGSLVLKVMERDEDAEFVGQWAPTLLLLGVYNKIVKVHGSDSGDRM